jgi:hypothetical protein
VKAYIGAKIIKAEPCTRVEFYGSIVAADPNNAPGYRVQYPDGYVSWSPKATFEEAYRELSVHERALVAEGGSSSLGKLDTCDPRLVRLVKECMRLIDAGAEDGEGLDRTGAGRRVGLTT